MKSQQHQAPYDKFAKFYDLEYGHKDNDLEFYLALARSSGSPVLEIGIGTARVASRLAAAGFSVVGIDNSARMLKKATQQLSLLKETLIGQVHLVHADMRNFNLEMIFPLCIIPFRAFLHNLTMDEQLETLAQIRRHLEPGGTLAFDLFVPLYQVISASEWRDKIDEDELHSENSGVSIEIKIKHRPEQQILRVTNTYFSRQDGKTRLATMNYRYVFRYEMEALLRLSGFQTIEVFGGFEKQQYNYHSGIMIFIAKRI